MKYGAKSFLEDFTKKWFSKMSILMNISGLSCEIYFVESSKKSVLVRRSQKKLDFLNFDSAGNYRTTGSFETNDTKYMRQLKSKKSEGHGCITKLPCPFD